MTLYRFLLRLLPHHRRAAYGDEMRDVFAMAVESSRERGAWRVMTLWLREVMAMVKFALRERFGAPFGPGRQFRYELKWAWRSVRKRGWAGAFAILLIALAIAANGIVFAAVDALAITRTPYPAPDRLVSFLNAKQPDSGPSLAKVEARRLLEHAAAAQSMAAFGRTTIFLQGNGISERVNVVNATPGLFTVLGTTPRWGRTFSSEDVRTHDSDVVVISETLARARFGTPAAAVGQTLDTTDAPLRIVGVMPSTFRFPDGTIDVWRGLDFDGPLATIQFSLTVLARLSPGQTLGDLNGLLRARYDPGSKVIPEASIYAVPLRDSTRFFALLGAALCLLITACANAAGLEVVAAFGRARSYAIQRTLGASRWSLARSVMLEGAILIGLAGLAAWFLAASGLDLLVAELPRSYGVLPPNPIDLDDRALLFMAGTAAATWLVTALPVVLMATGANLLDVLKDGGRTQSGSKAATAFRQVLTVLQVALAVTLLVGGLLYAQTYLARVSLDKGFDSTNLASLTLILPPQEIPRLAAVRTSVLERISAHPGVFGVAGSAPPPLGDSPTIAENLEIDGTLVPSPNLRISRRAVTANYLELIAVRVVEGRLLRAEDSVDHVVISDAFARRFWPQGAVGHAFRVDPSMPVKTIVGVVSHIRSSDDRLYDEGASPVYYEPLVFRTGPAKPPAPRTDGRRIVSAASAFISMTMKLDTPARLPEIIATIRRDIPQFAVSGAMVSDTYRSWEAETRLHTTVITAFGALAFITALVGLYGVMMFLVAGRAREIGVRMALGATRRHVVTMVLHSAARMSIVGAVLGLLAAVSLSRFVESQLFGVTAVDWATYFGVASTVIVGTTLATWFPARRAARIDPVITLRAD